MSVILNAMKKLPVLLFAVAVLAARGEGTFNVRDFGAKGDGHTLDTAAIQKALDASGTNGGTVRFPPGTYLSQPLTLRGDHVTVELEAGATLLATTNPMDFMRTPGDWLKARSSAAFIPFIGGRDMADLTFTGGGTIDGSGHVWWGEAEKARERVPGYTLPRPDLLVLQRCRNVRVENITLQNSPKYHFVPGECEGLVVSNVTILAPEHAANTDGIDPGNCENVLITKCRIDTGDDNIAIKAGRRPKDREFACENITVSDCTFLHGHGMSIGSETRGGVRNVVVENCVFKNTENGIRIKSEPGKGGLVEDIRYRDLTMIQVDPAITFVCDYHNNSAKDRAQQPVPAYGADGPLADLPVYRDIDISNVTATCENSAGIILGLPGSPVTNVSLENVRISAPTGLSVQNAGGIRLRNVHLTVRHGPPFILRNASLEGNR